jgi:hypothetical protein
VQWKCSNKSELLPEEERAKVVRFVIEHEASWIPAEFREAIDEATHDGGAPLST